MESASKFLTRVCALFDATVAWMSGLGVASRQDCRESDGSWNMAGWSCHALPKFRM
jgi:hypothetical protein